MAENAESYDAWEHYQKEISKGYDNEKVVALVNSNMEVKEFGERTICFFRCPECGKEIEGLNRHRVASNAKTHVVSQHKNIYKEVD